MENQLISYQQEGDEDARERKSIRKYEKIVSQFDEIIQLLDGIRKPQKRRKVSPSSKKEKSTSAANTASKPFAAPPCPEGTSSLAPVGGNDAATVTSMAATSSVVLKQIITRHLNDLQMD